MELFKRTTPHKAMLNRIETLCQSLLIIKESNNKHVLNDVIRQIIAFINTLKQFDLEGYTCEEIANSLNEIRVLFAKEKGLNKVKDTINEAIAHFNHEKIIMVLHRDSFPPIIRCSGKRIPVEAIYNEGITTQKKKNRFEAYTKCIPEWYSVRIGDIVIIEEDDFTDMNCLKPEKKLTPVLTIGMEAIQSLDNEIPQDYDDSDSSFKRWLEKIKNCCKCHMLERYFLGEHDSNC